MIPLRRDDLSDIHFPIAAQKVFTCTEAARCAPERSPAARDAPLAPGAARLYALPASRTVAAFRAILQHGRPRIIFPPSGLIRNARKDG